MSQTQPNQATLRTTIAAQCTAAMVSSIDSEENYERLRRHAAAQEMKVSEWIAREAVKQADALLRELDHHEPTTEEPRKDDPHFRLDDPDHDREVPDDVEKRAIALHAAMEEGVFEWRMIGQAHRNFWRRVITCLAKTEKETTP